MDFKLKLRAFIWGQLAFIGPLVDMSFYLGRRVVFVLLLFRYIEAHGFVTYSEFVGSCLTWF